MTLTLFDFETPATPVAAGVSMDLIAALKAGGQRRANEVLTDFHSWPKSNNPWEVWSPNAKDFMRNLKLPHVNQWTGEYWSAETLANMLSDPPALTQLPTLDIPEQPIAHVNQWCYQPNDGWGTWDVSIAQGLSYLYGPTQTIAGFLAKESKNMQLWQKTAARWAWTNSKLMLAIDQQSPKKAWRIRRRGEYVELDLPHHDAGGERTYITRDFTKMVRVNED